MGAITSPTVPTAVTWPERTAAATVAAPSGIYYPFSAEDDTLQGANASLYTLTQRSRTGLRLAKATAYANLIGYFDCKTLTVTYADTAHLDGEADLYNDGVALSTAVADPHGGANNVWHFDRASTEGIHAILPPLTDGDFTVDVECYFITASTFYWLVVGGGKYDANETGLFMSAPNTGDWDFALDDRWATADIDLAGNAGTWTNGQWYQVRAVWDGTNLHSYVDGTRIATLAASFSEVHTIIDWYFGCLFSSGSPSNGLDGYLGGIAIYQEALSTGASYTPASAYIAGVYDTTNGIVYSDRTLDLGTSRTIDVSATTFDWADGTTGDSSSQIEIVAKDTDSWAIGDFTAGNFFEEGGTAHADVTGRYVRVGFRQNPGAFTNKPARLNGVGLTVSS